MPSTVIYAYILTTWTGDRSHPPLVFTWPNACKKYLRDTYTVDGTLALPPHGRLTLTRHKVNPKAGQRPVIEQLDIGEFLAG